MPLLSLGGGAGSGPSKYAPDIFCRLNVQIWRLIMAKGYSGMTRKLIKFDLFGFKLFSQVVQKHQ